MFGVLCVGGGKAGFVCMRAGRGEVLGEVGGRIKFLGTRFTHKMNLQLSTNAYNKNDNTLSHGYRQLL